MRVIEIPHGLVLCQPTEGYVRSAGLHASDIYNALYKKLDPARYDKKDEDGNATPFDLTKMEMGTSFEQVLEIALAARLLGERPGEFTSPEGVIYSPDYLFYEDETVLGEFKCSWYSTRDAPHGPKFLKWLTQIRIYSYWLKVRKARLYVLFVNGNYKPPSPVLKCWELLFTQRELDDEHAMLMRFARREGLLP